jgi:hypothetical protein
LERQRQGDGSESEDEKDPKRAHMVLSKGHEVVGPGYSRLLGDAARATDKGEETGNLGRVHGSADRSGYSGQPG